MYTQQLIKNPVMLTTQRHLRMYKPCISLRDHVDNDKTVTHIYAPFAHTPVE